MITFQPVHDNRYEFTVVKFLIMVLEQSCISTCILPCLYFDVVSICESLPISLQGFKYPLLIMNQVSDSHTCIVVFYICKLNFDSS